MPPASMPFDWEVAGSCGVITNLSVWVDVEGLAEFVYGALHRQVMRRRREWFLPMREAYLACWWVPTGHRPTTDDAERRVRHLRTHGPTPTAFTLARSFPPPERGSEPSAQTGRDDWLCPA